MATIDKKDSTFHMRLSDDLKSRLEDAARTLDTNLSGVVRLACEHYLDEVSVSPSTRPVAGQFNPDKF